MSKILSNNEIDQLEKEGAHHMLGVSLVMIVMYVIQSSFLIQKIISSDIKEQLLRHRNQKKEMTKIILQNLKSSTDSGESYTSILLISFVFSVIVRIMLFIVDMFGYSDIHSGFHRFLDCFGSVNMTVISCGVIMRSLLDVARLSSTQDLQIILRYQKTLVRQGLLALGVILFLQMFLVISEGTEGAWLSFVFIGFISFQTAIMALFSYNLWVKNQIKTICNNILHSHKISSVFLRMHITLIIVLGFQGTVSFLSAYLGAPTFSWFVNNYTGPTAPSFLFHVIYNEIVDFSIVIVYLLYYLPAIEENISKVQIKKDTILENYIQRRKDQIKRASQRSSKVKIGGYETADENEFVVTNKEESQQKGLFQLEYEDENGVSENQQNYSNNQNLNDENEYEYDNQYATGTNEAYYENPVNGGNTDNYQNYSTNPW